MIKQTMAALLLSTGLASVAQAQSAPSFSGITIGGAAVTGFSDRNGTCTLDHDYGRGFGTNNIVALNGKSCAETTWAEAAANVDRDFGRGSNPRPIRGYQAGTVFVTNGNAPETRSSIGSRASDGNGNIITYDVYNYQPVGTTTGSAITIQWFGGDDRRLTAGTVTGTGYYRRNSRTLYGVTSVDRGYLNADFTGVSVFNYQGNGGLLNPPSHLATIEDTPGGNCWIRTDRPLQSDGQRIDVTGSCSGYTWRSLDASSAFRVTGVHSSQLDRPILSGIDRAAAAAAEAEAIAAENAILAAVDYTGITVDLYMDGTYPLAEVSLVKQGESSFCRLRLDGSATRLNIPADSCIGLTWQRAVGGTATSINGVELSSTLEAPVLTNANPTDYASSRRSAEDNDGDTFNYIIHTPNGDPDVTEFRDGTLIISTHTVGQGPSAVTTTRVQGDVTGNGFYADTNGNYYEVTNYQAYVEPNPDIRQGGNAGRDQDEDSFTIDIFEIQGDIDAAALPLGPVLTPATSLDNGILRITNGDVTGDGFYESAQTGENGETYYYRVTNYVAAAGPVEPYVPNPADIAGITINDAPITTPSNVGGVCVIGNTADGTTVVSDASCEETTWAQMIAHSSPLPDSPELNDVPTAWLSLTVASTLPGYVAPEEPTDPEVPADPADTLSEWSAWVETSSVTGEEVEVSVSYKGKTMSNMITPTEVTEQRTRTVVINGEEDATAPAGELMEERTRTIGIADERARLLATLKAQYAAANNALKKQLESDIDYGTKLTATLKNGDKFVLNLTTVGVEYHRTYDIVKDGNTFHITPRVVAGGFIGGDANYVGGGVDVNVEIQAIKEALVKVGFDTGTYFKYWAGERDGFDELSGTGLTATRFYLDATKEYNGVAYNARVATDGVVHIEARKDKFTFGANTEGQLKVGFKTDFDSTKIGTSIGNTFRGLFGRN